MKSKRITRIVHILTTLQAGKSYNVSEMSRMFGTSRRTIFRDLKELQAIGIPYSYSAREKGYVIKPDFFLPPIDLNIQEALSILLLAEKTAAKVQSPFKGSALQAALKIENNLPPAIKKYCNKSLKHITTKVSPQAPLDNLDKTFGRLQKAILKKHEVEIVYRSLFDKKELTLKICPYHLLYSQRAWYLLGYSRTHRSIRTFKLNRIRQLQILENCFIGGDDFDLYEYLGRAWSMIPEGRIYNVKLRFMPKVAENVAEVRWHSTQKTKHCDDGSAIIEFRVDGLGEIFWWILGYGDQVQVLAPRVLRRRIVEAAKNIIELNGRI